MCASFAGNIGPDWACNLCTWGFVIAPVAGISVLSFDAIDIAVLISLIALAIITLGILAWTDFGDPFLPKQTPDELAMQREHLVEIGADLSFMSTCPYCHVIRPIGAKHCQTCDRCVYDLDREQSPPWHRQRLPGLLLLRSCQGCSVAGPSSMGTHC